MLRQGTRSTMSDLASVAAADAHKQEDAVITSCLALRSVDATNATMPSLNAIKFNLMGLPPELRLHVYENLQHVIHHRLPLRAVDIFFFDLDLVLLSTSH